MKENAIKTLLKRHQMVEDFYLSQVGALRTLITKIEYPMTFECLINFEEKLYSIRKMIIESKNSNNLYSANILLRCFFEHFIVSYYIWTKCRLDETDEYGEKYYIEYYISESLKREGYELKLDGIVNNIAKNNTFENIKKRNSFLKEMTQTEFEEFHTEGGRFDIAKIANYLINSVENSDPFTKVNLKIIISQLSRYNRLCSFVHGGPSAELYLKDKTADQISDSLQEIYYTSMLYIRSIRESILIMAMDIESEYMEFMSKMTKLK